jgi:hypothetical protein
MTVPRFCFHKLALVATYNLSVLPLFCIDVGFMHYFL